MLAWLIGTLVRLILSYNAEDSNLNKKLKGIFEVFEMQCDRKSMKIPYRTRNGWRSAWKWWPESVLLVWIRYRKLKYFSHISCHGSLLLGPMCGKGKPVTGWPYGMDRGHSARVGSWERITLHTEDSFVISPTWIKQVRYLRPN